MKGTKGMKGSVNAEPFVVAGLDSVATAGTRKPTKTHGSHGYGYGKTNGNVNSRESDHAETAG